MLKIGAAFAYEEAVRRVQELSRAVQADAKLPQKAQVHHMLARCVFQSTGVIWP